MSEAFKFGDIVRILPGGKVKWSVVDVGTMGVMLMSRNGATRYELPSNLRLWKD